MALHETDAFVLRTYKLADADKIVVMLTAEAGVVRGVARGARRLKSRFGAGLEPYTLVSVQYYEREGRELVVLRGAEILRSSFDLLQSPQLYLALEYISELTLEFTPVQEPNATLFRLITVCVEALAREPESYAWVMRYFEIWLLKLGGFFPDMRRCVICRRHFQERETVYTNVESGLICLNCYHPGRGHQMNNELRMAILTALRSSPNDFIKAREINGHTLLQELAQWNRVSIQRILERDNRKVSQSFLASDKETASLHSNTQPTEEER